ncbi:MAG TPA: Ig-like domain-containing protein [Gemmatimonas sp.]|nr:Ig-like domain-containing protein [Gemmatimonas sp.]
MVVRSTSSWRTADVTMTVRPIPLISIAACLFCLACEGTRVMNTSPSEITPAIEPSVLTTFAVFPETATLVQGASVYLTLHGADQRGATMPLVGAVSFSTSDTSVATVNERGEVTGLAAGVAEITVATTAGGGVIKGATMKATITRGIPVASVDVTVMGGVWHPTVAQLTAGGTVRWNIPAPKGWPPDVPHESVLVVDGKYRDVVTLKVTNGSSSFRFETPGLYRYCSALCEYSWDFGVVYVH